MLDALDLRFYYKQIEKEPLRASRKKKVNMLFYWFTPIFAKNVEKLVKMGKQIKKDSIFWWYK